MKNIFENLKSIAFAITIAILLPITMHLGIQLINPYPSYSPLPKSEAKELRKQHQAEHRVQVQHYNQRYFYSALIIGIIAFIAGAFFPIDFIGAGLIIGALECFVVGYLHYWDKLNELVKFLSMLGVFLLVFIISYLVAKKRT